MLLVVIAAVAAPSTARAGIEAEVEAGVVFVGRNDARIPGNGGTKFSLVNDLSTDPAPVFRLRLGYRIAGRHLITALYAPLQINARGTVGPGRLLHGGTYPAGSPLLAVYRFDSYRLTYRFSISGSATTWMSPPASPPRSATRRPASTASRPGARPTPASCRC